MESIDLPDIITNIGEFAFNNCTMLKNVSIPRSLTVLKGGVFNNTI